MIIVSNIYLKLFRHVAERDFQYLRSQGRYVLPSPSCSRYACLNHRRFLDRTHLGLVYLFLTDGMF